MITHGNRNGREEPIDIPWVFYIGMNKLGFTYRQTGQMYFGLWVDLYEMFKKQYNFEKKQMMYVLQDYERVSIMDL